MTAIVQEELDLAGEQIETVWNRQMQADAGNWTEEALCLQWLCPGDAPDWAWWRCLRTFERESWLNEYRLCRFAVENGGKMPEASAIFRARDQRFQQMQELARVWAIEIREAFKAGRRMPIIPAHGFEVALDMAINMAQIPIACLMAAEKKQTQETEHNEPE